MAEGTYLKNNNDLYTESHNHIPVFHHGSTLKSILGPDILTSYPDILKSSRDYEPNGWICRPTLMSEPSVCLACEFIWFFP